MIIKPIITEKALGTVGGLHQYTFLVSKEATKSGIKELVEKTFNVHVKGIRTITGKGKEKRAGRKKQTITRSDFKKAIISILASEKIDLFSQSEKK